MANKIPLNLYKRVSKKLSTESQIVYTAPENVASTIISFLGTNTTDENRLITLSLSSAQEEFVTLFDYKLQPLEFTNLLPFKIILTENDKIVATSDVEDNALINDEGLFWLYDIPTQNTLTNVQLQLQVLPPTQVIINWGDTGTNYTTTVLGNNITQNVLITFVNETLETGVNVTLSILESNNSQNA